MWRELWSIALTKQMNINTLIQAMPAVSSWIDSYIGRHVDSRVRMSDAGFARIPDYFSLELLQKAYYVLVPRVETPPLAEFGLGEFSFFESGSYGGITFKDTFFVTSKDESLHFHEMIHIVQWDELGPEKFLLAYGLGLVQWGYRDSPLEQIAYAMQATFDSRGAINDLEDVVREHCRALAQKAGL